MTYSSKLALLLPLLGMNEAFKSGNYRAHVTTKKFCIDNIKDAQGNSAPCATSTSMATAGYTLPGMEDNSVTTREDVIVAHGGMVSVKAMPNRPYQFLMTTQTATHEKQHMLFRNQAFSAGESESPYQSSDAETLADGGWAQVAADAGSSELKFVKNSAGGVDPSTGVNYTDMYTAGIAPDTWTLYTDKEENPLRVLASNSFNEDKVYQQTEFSNVQQLAEDFDVDAASSEMHSTYQIDDQSARLLQSSGDESPPVVSVVSVDFLPESVRQFYEGRSDLDWMRRRNLREAAVNGNGIAYFTIEKGSAAELYFNAKANRQLVSVVKFEFPKGCMDGDDDKYCLSIDVDASTDNVSVAVGMKFVDVNDKSKTASLKLSLVLASKDGDMALSLKLEASGCAVVWQYGAGVSLQVTVCIYGAVEGKDLTNSAKRSIVAELKLSVKFSLNVPGYDLIDATVEGVLKATAAPSNVITAFGSLSVVRDIKAAGAGMGLDINAKTVGHNTKKWHFDSGAFFNAYTGVWIFKVKWSDRFQIWEADATF